MPESLIFSSVTELLDNFIPGVTQPGAYHLVDI